MDENQQWLSIASGLAASSGIDIYDGIIKKPHKTINFIKGDLDALNLSTPTKKQKKHNKKRRGY
jgi:pullulanase/glycogen debranching enzyme